ncbi:MAG: PEP/pyruvate-binding domain-containing protein [Candidatus Nanoarchaeia archaeon]
MQNIISLGSITESDLFKVGCRAVNLNKIQRTKTPIPLSFVIPNLVFEEFLLQNRLVLEIRKIIDGTNKSPESYEEAHSKIKSLFADAKIPDEFKEELQEAYEALGTGNITGAQSLLENKKPVVNLIISPSYDWNSESLSGVILNIHDYDNFLNAIKSCWLSLYSTEQLEIRDKRNLVDFSAGIIVQELIDSECTLEVYSKSIIGNYEIPLYAYFGLPDITRTITKDFYSVSRETFGLAVQEVKRQEQILMKNDSSGTLIKRNLGSRGTAQKIIDKYIFEIARLSERLSVLTEMHFKIIFLVSGSEKIVFLVDKIGERIPDFEKEQKPKEQSIETPLVDLSGQEIKVILKEPETLASLISSPIEKEEKEVLPMANVKDPATPLQPTVPEAKKSSAFAWQKAISSDLEKTNPSQSVKVIVLDEKKVEIAEEKTKEPDAKIIILDENDDFILSPKKEESKKSFMETLISTPIVEDDSLFDIANKAQTMEKKEEHIEDKKEEPVAETKKEDSIEEKKVKQKKDPAADYEFYMSVILDLEPALDQEITTMYQEKFGKVPENVGHALEELDLVGGFPEKEQIYKLKNMKELLEKGEPINLELFLDITERLRKII